MYDVHVHVDLLYSCLTVTNGLKTKLAPRHHLHVHACTNISTGRQCLALSMILWAYGSTNVATAVIGSGLKSKLLLSVLEVRVPCYWGSYMHAAVPSRSAKSLTM